MALATAILSLAVTLAPDSTTPLDLPADSQHLQPADSQSGCWVEPLQLTLPEVLAMGHVEQEYVRRHCVQRLPRYFDSHAISKFTIGENRFGSFWLFGESIPFGFNVVVRPGALGQPDETYVVPALDLPKPWLQAIDYATYPVLIVGGAALATTVILQLVHH
jgi:hypothetical protein